MTRSAPTAEEIVDAIGRARLAASLDVTLTAISNAYVSGSFPASWFGVTEALCLEVGISCPRTLFRFRAGAGVAPAGAEVVGEADAEPALPPPAEADAGVAPSAGRAA